MHNHKHSNSYNQHEAHSHINLETNTDKRKTIRLFLSIILNIIITIAEIVGGLISGSLSLLSDALHNLTDVISMIISLFAIKISKKASTNERTFGNKRAEIVASMINGVFLVGVAFLLVKESIVRLIEPDKIESNTMIIVAVIGLFGNLISAILLYSDSKHSLNIRSTYLHIASDTISSIGVILGGLIIYFTNWFFVDSILTLIISMYILYLTYKMLMEIIKILMQHAPSHLNIQEIEYDIEKIDDVQNIHHIHLWSLDEKHFMFEAHVKINQDNLSKMELIKSKIKFILIEKYNIRHSTLEFEYEKCNEHEICI